MSRPNHPGSILPQFNDMGDDDDQPGVELPFSEVEVEELLYGEDRPAADRVARLMEFRDELVGRQSTDFFDDDAKSLLGEIERAIARLNGEVSEVETDDDLEFDDAVTADFDPADHRELLSPDDDLREDIEAEDEESVLEDLSEEDLIDEDEDDMTSVDDEAVLDPEEWDDEDKAPRH